jgi:deoxyribodipyrimidine photo-lyase
LPVYILDRTAAGDWAPGGASEWWLHQSLLSLQQGTDGALRVFCGDSLKILRKLIKAEGASSVYWNRCYEPWCIEQDSKIKTVLRDKGTEAHSFSGALLFEPTAIHKADGLPYKVFTPFYKRGCLPKQDSIRKPAAKPDSVVWHKPGEDFDIDPLKLLGKPEWHAKLEPHWRPGEPGAQQRLSEFAEGPIKGYQDKRNFPALGHTSLLSPHLHFGEISPHQAWDSLRAIESKKSVANDVELFRRQLIWREFSYSLLYHWPGLPSKNWQSKFDAFPWRKNARDLRRWQQGKTGYPIVDAGMRELWDTGYMHNRVRMIVGSFLVKNLLIHWRQGEDWFWDTLVDADLANNSASWQWVAGSGADAAPYFRIFNPVTQGEKFDPDGEYVRRYVPELAALPNKWIHKPWLADDAVLKEAGVRIGDDYPKPMVDLKASRQRALDAFQTIKK